VLSLSAVALQIVLYMRIVNSTNLPTMHTNVQIQTIQKITNLQAKMQHARAQLVLFFLLLLLLLLLLLVLVLVLVQIIIIIIIVAVTEKLFSIYSSTSTPVLVLVLRLRPTTTSVTLHVPPSVEYGQPYGFSCSRSSVSIHFKPLLGIVTRKDFYFKFF
jgi:hypothetical protein